MKKSVLFLFIFMSSLVFAQRPKSQKIKYVKVIQKVCSNQRGVQLVLKEVLSDSRCPVGVNCIWAGEIKVVVSVYQDKKFIKEETLTISGSETQENIAWFAQHLPTDKRNVKSINVLPDSKEGVKIKAKDYYIKVAYIK
ncbi:MAG: putative TIM-barrel enzyme [Flavobacterium sp.]|jgi:predicted TIM-barrel enzyme